ncbi:MAG TPA: MFS transporter [Euzebyales bacterium]|nr:MFS transporter [Euzebyales bacterium]
MPADGYIRDPSVAAPAAAAARFGRRYRLLWSATASANLADGVMVAAGPLLAASITRDPLLVSGLVVAQRLPWFLLSLPSGAIVDRYDRRRVMIAANLLRACVLGLLASTLVVGIENLVVLYAAMFAMGVSETFVDNAALAVLPAVVAREDIEAANGRIFATQSVMNELGGPPLGSWLFTLAVAAPFGGAAVAFAAAALLLTGMRGTYSATTGNVAGRRSMVSEMREGFRWFWSNRIIRIVAMMAGVVNFFSAATMGVLVLVAQERLGVGDAGYGVMLGFAAVGGILGGWLAGSVAKRIGWGPAIFVSNVLPAISHAGIALTGSVVVATCVLALASFAGMVGNVVVVSLRQIAIPDHMLGRVTSVYRMFGLGALPLGAAFGGATANAFGLTAPFWIAAACLGAMAFALLPVLTTQAISRARHDEE